MTNQEFKFLFGEDYDENNLDEILKKSKQKFVRSQDQIAFDSEPATGLRISAKDAYDFYKEILPEILEYGSAVIYKNQEYPSNVLIHKRESIGMSVDEIRLKFWLSDGFVERLENKNITTNIHTLNYYCGMLGLNIHELHHYKF